MRARLREAVEPHTSSARHATGGEVREAYELWWRGYADTDRWVCVDDNCKAVMTPCCWKRSDEHGPFLTKAGVAAKLPPFFRAEGGHGPECKVSLHGEPHDHTPPEYHLAVPTNYPARVRLSREPSGNARQKTRSLADDSFAEESDRRRLRPTYGIGEACEYYADHPDEHWRRLQVQDCRGATYDECFVRLGTGNHRGVGKNWIFFDQLWLGGYIDLGDEPLVLPLLTTVYGEPRRLAVRTSSWPDGDREALEERLLKAIIEARKAIREGRPHRAWMFFYGREADFNQTEYDVAIEPGVDVSVRHFPRHWTLRTGNAYQAKRRSPILAIVPPEPPPSSIVALPEEPTYTDPPPYHVEDEPGIKPFASSDSVTGKTSVSTGTDITSPSVPPADSAAEAGPSVFEAGLEESDPISEDAGNPERGGVGAEGQAPAEELQLDEAAPDPANLETSAHLNSTRDLPPLPLAAAGAQDIETSDSVLGGADPDGTSPTNDAVALEVSVPPRQPAPVMSNEREQPASEQPPARISKIRKFIDRLFPSRFASR